VIWITAGEVFLEQSYAIAAGVEAYAITGFFYTLKENRLEATKCFQAIYTRDCNNRPEWFSFPLKFNVSGASSCTSRPANQTRFEITELDTGVDESLRALYVVNENVIWASGTKGTYLVSNNGGWSWKVGTVASATENDFRSIHAWDENRAMIFGVAGPVFGYLTEDGGDTWTVVYKDNREAVFFNSLKFADSTHGIALSDPVEDRFLVLRTTDGGQSWLQVKDLPQAKDGEANFAASNSCIETLPSGKAWFVTGGVSARVFYSTDFGTSWQVTDTPLVQGQDSTDNGRHWRPITDQGYYTCRAVPGQAALFAAGSNGRIAKIEVK
jgi:hypothetical protein